MKKPRVIKSPRLLIKPPSKNDYSFFENSLRDPEVMRFQGGVMTEEEIHRSTENMKTHWKKHGFGRYSVFLKSEDIQIGIVSLKFLSKTPDQHPIPDLGYYISSNYQQQGYAREACQALLDYGFNSLTFKLIRATTYYNNTPGIKVLKTLGFRKTGSEEIIYNGKNYGNADRWELESPII